MEKESPGEGGRSSDGISSGTGGHWEKGMGGQGARLARCSWTEDETDLFL